MNKYQVRFGWLIDDEFNVKFDDSFIKVFDTKEQAKSYVNSIRDIMVETRDQLWDAGIPEEEILQLCKCYDSWEIKEI